MVRVLFFGTHPSQYNGYSKVVYEMMTCLAKRKDFEFTVYGFQKFGSQAEHRADLPSNIELYDAFANENPKSQGFGITEVRAFVKTNKPDVCIIYNDMMILHQVITQLKLAQKEDGATFKIIAYIDQVYLNQKKEFIEFINANADYAMMFTKFWQDIAIGQGIKLPYGFLPHGFNKDIYYPIPKHLARLQYGIGAEDFIILNLNRNQPRKRWDVCLKAMAEIVCRYPNEPIKMLVGTAIQGAWNLIEIYERELKKRGLTLEDGMKHLIVFDRPQKVTDEETNILYNVADIGINTCDGEGFGLCNFEQAALGIPQIVPRLGGFIDFFDDESAILVDPKLAYYVDNTRDAVCGEALMSDYNDFVEGIECYYFNKEKRAKHGAHARAKILRDYKWQDVADKLCKIIGEVAGLQEIADLVMEVDKLDLDFLQKLVKAPAPVAVPTPDPEPIPLSPIALEPEPVPVAPVVIPVAPEPTPVAPVVIPVALEPAPVALEPAPVAPEPETVPVAPTPVATPVHVYSPQVTLDNAAAEKAKKKSKRQKELLKLQKKLAELLGDSDDSDDE